MYNYYVTSVKNYMIVEVVGAWYGFSSLEVDAIKSIVCSLIELVIEHKEEIRGKSPSFKLEKLTKYSREKRLDVDAPLCDGIVDQDGVCSAVYYCAFPISNLIKNKIILSTVVMLLERELYRCN